MFVCPDCKTELQNLYCKGCNYQFERTEQIPILLSNDRHYRMAGDIAKTYDDVYRGHSKVWEDQGRTTEFIAFFAGLAAGLSTGSVLEIGCGEGFLLSSLRCSQLAAIDLSSAALGRARKLVPVNACVALAERLPFPDQAFDLVLAVGVMEHFLSDSEATREILRVLKTGGSYLTLIHISISTWETVRQKIREYFYPRPRPIAFAQWIIKKVARPISQPIQRPYTRQTALTCLEEAGFKVKEIISTRTHRDAPLIGPHVLAFVAQKP